MKQQQFNENDFSNINNLINEYGQKQEKLKMLQDKFKKVKMEMNTFLEKYFQKVDTSTYGLTPFQDGKYSTDKFTITRIQSQKVNFDVQAVEKGLKKVDKSLIDDCILKTYIIYDMPGLVAYLKECGVDPKVFKSFVNVEKSLNQSALDNLFDTGKIKISDLKDCYSVIRQPPYFKVTKRKVKDE